MANTRWPTNRFVELPNVTGKSDSAGASIFSTATSVSGSPPTSRASYVVAVEKRDVDLAGAVDHVEVRQHVALAVDHAAAPFALRFKRHEQIARDALRVDVHHASVHLLVDDHVDSFLRHERVQRRRPR